MGKVSVAAGYLFLHPFVENSLPLAVELADRLANVEPHIVVAIVITAK